MHDTLIRGGTVVDGTGGPARVADVAISGGRVVAIGEDLGSAGHVVDAAGSVVTPGFVDPHTHLDAQLFWDPGATPSRLHGVTTVTLSACGFGVAPCGPGDRDYVLRSLEAVEEIPFATSDQALPSSWGSWAEFAAALDRLPLGVNVASFVPHSPLRRAVLGGRSQGGHPDDDDISRVVDAYTGALEAGALGLATSRQRSHVDASGTPIPSRFASDRELSALVGASEGRPWQIALEAGMNEEPGRALAEIDTYVEWTLRSGARLSWSSLVVMSQSDTWRHALGRTRQRRADGCPVFAQVTPRPIVVTLSLADNSSYRALRLPGWAAAFQGFPHAGRTEARSAYLARRDVRAELCRATEESAGALRVDRWVLAYSPSRPEATGKTLAEVFGASPIDDLIDLWLEDDLATIVEIPVANDEPAEVRELCTGEGVLFGLGDSGAHLASVTSYSYPTFVLSTFVRDDGAMEVEEAVHRMTAVPAEHLGLSGRGQLRPGFAADVCVIDLDSLRLGPTQRLKDLPGGQTRLFQPAHGYQAVLVNGELTVANDVPLDRPSGVLLRA